MRHQVPDNIEQTISWQLSILEELVPSGSFEKCSIRNPKICQKMVQITSDG